MAVPQYRTVVERDSDANVWVVDASNIPGLVAEAGDLPALYEAISQAVPLLITENLIRGPITDSMRRFEHEIIVIQGNGFTDRKIFQIDLGPGSSSQG